MWHQTSHLRTAIVVPCTTENRENNNKISMLLTAMPVGNVPEHGVYVQRTFYSPVAQFCAEWIIQIGDSITFLFSDLCCCCCCCCFSVCCVYVSRLDQTHTNRVPFMNMWRLRSEEIILLHTHNWDGQKVFVNIYIIHMWPVMSFIRVQCSRTTNTIHTAHRFLLYTEAKSK